jgi:alpha-glucosidase (family GH31 glycosyl hydrolase)
MSGAAAAAAALWLPGCGSDDDNNSPTHITSGTFSIPKTDFTAEVSTDGRVKMLRASKTVTQLGADGKKAGLTWRRTEHNTTNIKAEQALGAQYGKDGLFLNREFFHTQALSDFHRAAHTFNVSRTDSGIVVVLMSGQNGMAAIEVSGVRPGVVKITLSAPDGFNEIAQTLPCAPEERFYGMGGQTWSSQHRGATIPMWTVPVIAGKAPSKAKLDPLQIESLPYDCNTPIPWYFSSKGYGLSLDTFRRSIFEFSTKAHPQHVRILTWSGSASFYLFTGDSPKALVSAYTGIVGRHTQMPPDWFFAPQNDAVRGSANVRRVAKKLRDHHIPSSVIWTEDWAGAAQNETGFRLAQSWSVGNNLYPDFTDLADELHHTGYRFLGYFAPFVPNPKTTPGFNVERYQTATQNNYLFEKANGKPYPMLTPPLIPPPGYASDWTFDKAVHWYEDYVRRAAQAGLDGAMVDYGEWTPFAAHFHNGATGANEHNRRPLRWQQANREIWDKVRPDGDYLFYVRSGYTGTQKHVPAVWAGDQLTNWDRAAGLPSVITMGINLGLCGVSFFGSDIGGYAAYPYPGLWHGTTTKDLFLRWAALGAFTPLMRTHHGSKYGENWSWEGAPNPDNPKVPIPDPDTVRIYKHWATAHIRLFPYLKAFARQSLDTGLPIMRHMILEKPDDPVVQGRLPDAFTAFSGKARGEPPVDELFQYYLGTYLLVAPIIDPDSTQRLVYLPAGPWYRIETGTRFNGPATITAHAAHDEMPVFAPGGAIIPRLPSGVETLVPIDDPDITDQADLAGRLELDVYFGGTGDLTLDDGTRFEFSPNARASAPGTASLNGTALSVNEEGHTLSFDTPALTQGTLIISNSDGKTAKLSLASAPEARVYTVRAHY